MSTKVLEFVSRRNFVGIILFFSLVACNSPRQPQATPSKVPTENFQTSTSTPTARATPMISAKEAQTLVSNLFANSANCDLPCIWGITPGETTIADVEALIAPLKAISQYAYPDSVFYEDGMIGWEVRSEDELVIIQLDLTFSSQTELVETIHFSAWGGYHFVDPDEGYSVNPDFDSDIYQDLFSIWEMGGILGKYGPPNQIAMTLENHTAEPNAPDFFKTWFLHPAYRTIIMYEANAEVSAGQDGHYGTEDDMAFICPAEAFVELWILEDSNQQTFDEKLTELTYYWTDSTFIPERFKSVQDAMGLSVFEFTNALIEGANPCFETLVDLWPPL